MATIIKLKRSETASSVPTTSDLAVGEVALNTVDRKIYVRDSSNNIIEVANATSAGSAGSSLTNGSYTFELGSDGVLTLPNTAFIFDSTATFSTTSSGQTLDSFSATDYRSAKYIIQAFSGADVHVTELLLTHDDTTVYKSESNITYSTSSLITLDASISSGNVVVTVTPANADTTVDFYRTTLLARTLDSFTFEGDLQSLSGAAVDLQTATGDAVDLSEGEVFSLAGDLQSLTGTIDLQTDTGSEDLLAA